MNLSRSISKSISRMLIGVLLFAQFAVASYACPKLSGIVATPDGKAVVVMPVAVVADTAATQPAAMPPGCDQMDPTAANLCAEHCRYSQQSVDTAPTPLVPVLPGTLPVLAWFAAERGFAGPTHA